MRLKILIVPFSIIMTLIVAIGYAQPDYALLQTKRAELANKQAQAASLGQVAGNVARLKASLDAQGDAERLITAYYPDHLDQEGVIDKLNFIASQSGVLVSDISVQAPTKDDTAVATTAAETAGLFDPTAAGATANGDGTYTAADGTILGGDGAPATFKPAARTFSASVKAEGSYENLRAFFDRLSHMDRLHGVSALSLGTKDSGQSSGSGAGGLTGSYTADFSFVPNVKVTAALNLPIFQKSRIALPVADRIRSYEAALPAIGTPQTGKPNPFQ